MGFPVLFLFICISQKTIVAQPNIADVESKASAIVQQAKSQILILTNQLETNVSLLTRSAEGNASLLLANLYNDINKGIAEAQAKAAQIGHSLQANFSKRSDEVLTKAAAIYTKVQAELWNSTSRIEKTIGRMINSTEVEIKNLLNNAKSFPSLTTIWNPPKPDVNMSTTTNNPESP